MLGVRTATQAEKYESLRALMLGPRIKQIVYDRTTAENPGGAVSVHFWRAGPDYTLKSLIYGIDNPLGRIPFLSVTLSEDFRVETSVMKGPFMADLIIKPTEKKAVLHSIDNDFPDENLELPYTSDSGSEYSAKPGLERTTVEMSMPHNAHWEGGRGWRLTLPSSFSLGKERKVWEILSGSGKEWLGLEKLVAVKLELTPQPLKEKFRKSLTAVL